MLLPRSYAWTPLQKWIVVCTVVIVFALVTTAIWSYERYSRVTDSVFVGTWRFPALGGHNIYFRLNADHTFRSFTDDVVEKDSPLKGLWFGGGDFLYFRSPTFDRDGFLTDHPLSFWRVERIAPNELLVRLNPGGVPRTVRRATPDSP